jgi:phage terminase large subunit-like protein
VSQISTACPDWEQRLIDGRSLVPMLDLDVAEGARAARWFDRLRLPDVIGQPLIGDVVGDWYRDALRALFGSYDKATGVRRIATVHMILPKKQGKTTLSGGTMLTTLLMNKRPNARFGILGATQKISGEAYDSAASMIEAEPRFQKLLKPTDHLKLIEHRLTGAYLEVTSFDPKVATGGKFAGCLIDELHVLGSVSVADRVIGQIRGARIAFRESFIWLITTQSEDPPAGIFAKELKYARGVRDGRIDDPTYLPIIYEFPKSIQEDKSRPWENPNIWHRVMPSLGAAVSREILEEQFRAEKEKGEADVRRWASQHLNIEVGLALRSDGWVGADYWEAAGDKSITLDALLEESDVVTIGIDNGGADDLFGLVVLGRAHDDGEETIRKRVWRAWGHAWCNSSAIERRKREASKFYDFERDGDLTIVERDGDLLAQVGELVARIDKTGKLASIGLDKIGMPLLVDALSESLPDKEERLIPVPQGFQLMGYAQAVEWKLRDGTFKHAAQPLMAYAVSNAKVEPKGNAIVITKAASGWAKIDPLMALLDAVAPMSLNPAANSISVFDVMARKSTSSPAQSDDDDESILANPAHPQWQEARERWERKHLSTDDIWG